MGEDKSIYLVLPFVVILGAFTGHLLGAAVAINFKGLVEAVEITSYSYKWGFATALMTFVIVEGTDLVDRGVINFKR